MSIVVIYFNQVAPPAPSGFYTSGTKKRPPQNKTLNGRPKGDGPAARPTDAFAAAPVLAVEDERDLAEEIRLEAQASGHPVQLLEMVEDGLRAAR